MSITDIVKKLSEYWESQGCEVVLPYDVEKGAATLSPHTLLGVLGSKSYNIAYIEMCRRAQDARYGENPSRVFIHHQFQVIMKPAPSNIEELYLNSLRYLGVDIESNSILFLEDNWSQPTLGAWGLGSEIRFNGSEVTQFTYFKQLGNINLKESTIEIAYGLERLASSITSSSSIYDLDWSKNRSYSEAFKERERDLSKYIFEVSDSRNHYKLLNIYMEEAELALKAGLPLAAYDNILKASGSFNILDAKRAIFDKERNSYILKLSKLTKSVCEEYIGE